MNQGSHDQPVTIRASTTLLTQMQDRWSDPVRVYLHHTPSGWEATFRTYNPDEDIELPLPGGWCPRCGGARSIPPES
jgi:hypothetical protein